MTLPNCDCPNCRRWVAMPHLEPLTPVQTADRNARYYAGQCWWRANHPLLTREMIEGEAL